MQDNDLIFLSVTVVLIEPRIHRLITPVLYAAWTLEDVNKASKRHGYWLFLNVLLAPLIDAQHKFVY